MFSYTKINQLTTIYVSNNTIWGYKLLNLRMLFSGRNLNTLAMWHLVARTMVDTLVDCIWQDSLVMVVLSTPFDVFRCLSFTKAIKTTCHRHMTLTLSASNYDGFQTSSKINTNPLDILWIITQSFIKFFNLDIIPKQFQRLLNMYASSTIYWFAKISDFKGKESIT